MESILDEICKAVIGGDAVIAKELTEKAVAQNIAPQRIFKEALGPGMDEIGRKMETGECYIPEGMLSARAMKIASEVLRPLIAQNGSAKTLGRVLFGTVEGDLHDIGKNLVIMLLKGTGFEVIDLGINVPTEQFIEKVKAEKPDILAMSALITTTMGKMEEVIKRLQTANCRESTIVMVGGAPVNQEFAQKIGADGYAGDAGSAARLAKRLLTNRSKH